MPMAKKAKKSVRFATQLPPSLAPTLPTSLPSPRLSNPRCVKKNFCDNLRQCLRQLSRASSCFVLEDTGYSKQLVYPSYCTPLNKQQKPMSLRRLIKSTLTPGSDSGILLHERMALAKKFAIAVLQYHVTPWMQLAWRSDDIFFFGVKDDKQADTRPSFSAPYINAKIQQQNDHSPTKRSGMARNPLLFSLGVLLLEIAHVKSLEDLQLDRDIENGELHKEFFTARRLAKTKRSNMGAIYDNIAEQLVECIFPCGDDLNNLDLQASFYQDVICPLDELEQDLRKLGL